MRFERSNAKDIPEIMKIIEQAKIYFKNNNINQWQNGYPNPEIIKIDIEKQESYKLTLDEKIIATAVISFNGEPTYDEIYEGEWLSNESFAVVHRIATDNSYKGQGIAGKMIKKVEELCIENNVTSIKIDTHEDNISMQKSLQKNGFKYCGVIYLQDKSKRVAFEKLIK